MNLIDCHSHTHNSPDSNESVETMCEKAIELGLSAYTITDHCEAHLFYPENHYQDKKKFGKYDVFDSRKFYESSVNEVTAAKDAYRGRLKLLCGIELGQATYDPDASEIVASDSRIDFIIGSLHQLDGIDDFYFLDYSQYEIKELLRKYYATVLEICRWNKFDVLGHITYPLRYIQGESGIPVDMTDFRDAIAECFRTATRNGKGIEINTSGLRQKFSKCFPDADLLRLYKDIGGEILTVGSDAHRVSELGSGIADGIRLAKSVGFDKICYFEKHQPQFIKITD